MIMSTVLRTWLLVLLLVHHATSTFDMLGCIKGFPCGKHSMPKRLKELIAGGYELIGFTPAYGNFKAEDKRSWIDMWSSPMDDILGNGAYLFEKYVVARDYIRYNTELKPKMCSVFVRSDKLKSWSWIYIPRSVKVYDTSDEEYELSTLYWAPNALKIYLEVSGYAGQDHSGVLVADWGDGKASAGKDKRYFIKIPKSYLDDTIFYCRGLSDTLTPEYLEILKTDLKWEEKFRSVWKLWNYPIPMDITARERFQDGVMLWSPRLNTKASALQDEEGSTMDNDISRSRSGVKSAPPTTKEEK